MRFHRAVMFLCSLLVFMFPAFLDLSSFFMPSPCLSLLPCLWGLCCYCLVPVFLGVVLFVDNDDEQVVLETRQQRVLKDWDSG